MILNAEFFEIHVVNLLFILKKVVFFPQKSPLVHELGHLVFIHEEDLSSSLENLLHRQGFPHWLLNVGTHLFYVAFIVGPFQDILKRVLWVRLVIVEFLFWEQRAEYLYVLLIKVFLGVDLRHLALLQLQISLTIAFFFSLNNFVLRLRIGNDLDLIWGFFPRILLELTDGRFLIELDGCGWPFEALFSHHFRLQGIFEVLVIDLFLGFELMLKLFLGYFVLVLKRERVNLPIYFGT